MKTVRGTDINQAASLLRAGSLVAIPTETVYGLAANALNDDAVLNIYKAKNRPSFNPLILHVENWAEAKKYITAYPADAAILANHFWPGPLTLLLPKNKNVPDIVTSGSHFVALRAPNHPLTISLLKALDFPLAAPSANPSGFVSPTTASHVMEGLNGKIPYVLDGGSCSVGLESTIIGWDNEKHPVVYRLGGISTQAIENVLGKPLQHTPSVLENPETPGQLKSHYATHTPLYLGNLSDLMQQHQGKKIAVIQFSNTEKIAGVSFQFTLSPVASTDEAAKNFFKTMREADACGAEVILCELMPASGLGPAINDRLSRAQAMYK